VTGQKTYYLTTAISYPNGAPHIGHAYEALATDTLARFKRLDGYDVFFLTGTDEHGQKMQQTATKKGLSAQEFADSQAPLFENMVKALNCSNNDFIRTTQERHIKASQTIWQRMEEVGDLYKSTYSGWYSVRDEAYYNEDETELREDGVRYGPQNTPVEWVEEDSYFFKLSAYQDKLLAHYEANPDFIGPQERRNEVISFVKSGLRDLSVSRTTFDWGIPVPGASGHVMYVWVDALTNYLTGVGYPDCESETYQKFWPADVHIIGKDIVRFHAVYWPAFLMSANLPLPKRVFAHGFLFNRGEKMSKSVGNVIDPHSIIENYGLDQTRYFFLREVPFGKDGNYSHDAIVARINADLANDLGNLAQRSLSMIFKNLQGQVGVPDDLNEDDQAILAQCAELLELCRQAMDRQAFHEALNNIWAVVAEANRYFAAQEPWALKKTDPARMEAVLWTTAEALRQLAILIQPFMPDAMSQLLDGLAIAEDKRRFEHLSQDFRQDFAIEKPQAVFPRFVEEEMA
jgi:methionyl-tRNA synthetase